MYCFIYSFYITACMKYNSREYRIEKIPQAVYKIITYQLFILPYTAQRLNSTPFHDNIVHKMKMLPEPQNMVKDFVANTTATKLPIRCDDIMIWRLYTHYWPFMWESTVQWCILSHFMTILFINGNCYLNQKTWWSIMLQMPQQSWYRNTL